MRSLSRNSARSSGGGDRLEIIGPVERGRAVEVGRPDLLQRREEIARRILAAVEHQMLEQMRKARTAPRLVLRPDVIPDRYRDDRRLAVGVHDHAQPVLQRELLIGNIDRGDERGDRCRLCDLRANRRDKRGGGDAS